MTRQQIIDMAKVRTEGRGADVLNFGFEFLCVLQDFCNEYKWFWRRKSVTLATVPGTASYDLSSAAIVAGFTNMAFEKLSDVRRVLSATQSYILDPLPNTDAIANALADTTPGTPTHYFFVDGTTIEFTPVPSAAETIRITGWAVPQYDMEASVETVPLVPAPMHYVLELGLEARILAFSAGPESARTQAAQKAYEYAKLKAAEKRQFADNVYQSFMPPTEAVRSTD